jgi:hypothetical protein
MASKHQREPSSTTDEVAAARQRELATARKHRQRERQAQVSLEQFEQGESIIRFANTLDTTSSTPGQVGLRVQGLTLPQDICDAQQQHGANIYHEHHRLYHDHDIGTTNTPIPQNVPASQASQVNNLSRFFPSLPLRNPIPEIRTTTPLPPPTLPIPSSTHPTPHCDQFFPAHNVPGGSEDLMSRSDTSDEEDAYWDLGDVVNDPPNPTLDNWSDHVLDEPRQREDDERGSETALDSHRQFSPVNHPDRPNTPPSAHPASDDGEESDFDFDSEHSAEAAVEEETEVDTDPVSQVAEKLMDLFLDGIQGCTADEHRAQLQEHLAAHGNNHHGLNEVFNDSRFPSVLGLSTLLSTDRLARMLPPAPVQWRAMFCGVTPESPAGRPLQVCLHQEETQATEPQVAFDVDSFLGFTHSLAFARQGVWYQPAPQIRQNMTTDVHLKTSIYRDGNWHGRGDDRVPRATMAMLRDVPHFLLGRVEGAHDITVHILFPHLQFRGDKFQALTTEQFTRWFDQVFHPAVHQHCAAHYNQHVPPSFRVAFANSKARQVEGRMVETTSYQAQQAIGYHLQPHHLGPIWADVLDVSTHATDLIDFRDPQLFFSAKGTKLRFKSTPQHATLLDVLEQFQLYIADIIDMDLVDEDRFFIDVAKEVCPSVSVLTNQAIAFDEQPQTYLWRRCCQEKHAAHIYDGRPPTKGGRGQYYYTQNMLGEAGSLTSVPPKRSLLYRGGIRYFQLYASVKEVWDAAKSMPFDNEGLEEMALDPQIRQGARAAQGGRSRDAAILERAYVASKRRAHMALQDSARKSFGIREEYRISWRLFCRLQARLTRVGNTRPVAVVEDCPLYAWAVKTEVFLSFLWRSADKFATGFEVVRARARDDLVTWEQTKMMAMFLRCLQFVLSGHALPRESALWWSRRDRMVGQERRIWYGLGFSNTLPRYGYCWLEPRFDWTRLVFLPAVTDRVLFGNSMLRGRYLRRGGQVQDFFHLTRRLELALDWLGQYARHQGIRDWMISWIIHICLQQFRVDILASVRAEIRREVREEALRGGEPFCYEYFEEIMVGGVYLSSGNRAEIKVATHLGHCLFDYGDGDHWRRDHWEDRPFRKMYRRASTALQVRFGEHSAMDRRFRRRFWRALFNHHWILPHPAGGQLLQTTKEGHRMWYSLVTGATTDVARLEPSAWSWGRKNWQAGRPSPLPEYLSWDKGDWEDWLGRQRSSGNLSP